MPPSIDLAGEVGARLAAGEPCWFPGLAGPLVAEFWAAHPEMDSAAYTTAGWLGGAAAWRHPVAGLPGMAVEALPRAFDGRFEPSGIDGAAAAAAVASAMEPLALGGVAAPVATLIRAIHAVRARAAGYDCSHSEPGVPLSVLVSFPLGERDAEIRLAESLLHEAMHLQLTLIERRAPIALRAGGSGDSAGQRRPRPVPGQLHGSYVFAAIHGWLTAVAAGPDSPAGGRAYAMRRLAEIGGEIEGMSALPEHPGLTPLGRELARRLLQAVLGGSHRAEAAARYA